MGSEAIRKVTLLVITYTVVHNEVTVLLSTSLAWPAWAGCSRAELFSQPGTNFFAQPCINKFRSSLVMNL